MVYLCVPNLPDIYLRYTPHDDDVHFNLYIYDKPIGPAARVSVNNCSVIVFLLLVVIPYSG
jgi:hypothetical protein